MTDEENKKPSDLFGDSAAVKPLFGEEEALPQGKPLFDNEFSDPGDAAFVKPLFEDPEDVERTTLEDFQEFDDISGDTAGEAGEAPVPAVEYPSGIPVPPKDFVIENEVSAEENTAEEITPPYNPYENAEPAKAVNDPVTEEPAAPAQNTETASLYAPVFPQEEPLPEPEFAIPAEKIALPGDLESMSLGALMAYARETVKYSAEDVYNGTKINERYLQAIEEDQFEQLPSGAFPGAYVRALCSFYHLETSACEIAQKKAAAYCTACRPPDEVYDSLNEHAIINKEEQEKFRRIVTVAGIVLLIAILSIVTLVVWLSAKDDQKTGPAAPSPVKMENLEKLDPEPPQINASELNVPKK